MTWPMSGELAAAGDIAMGALAAHIIDPSGGAPAGAGDHALCLNCGTAVRGEYCHACGQAAHVHRTLRSIGHDLLHGVFHFEGRIWRTVPMLFTRPGELTRRYIAGERVRFVSPLALFLFSVFLMVATFETIGGPFSGDSVSVNVKAEAQKRTPATVARDLREKRALLATLQARRATMVAHAQDTDDIDDRIDEVQNEVSALQTVQILRNDTADPADVKSVHTGIDMLDQRLKEALKNKKLFLYRLQSTAYKYSWALIPISLPFIWILFAFRRDVGPYDHAIFAIYSLSAMTLGVVALSIGRAIGLAEWFIVTLFVLGPPFHMYRQLKGAYRLTRFAALWRTVALVLSAYVAALVFIIILLGLVAV